jgi:hypothetical protein
VRLSRNGVAAENADDYGEVSKLAVIRWFGQGKRFVSLAAR